MRIVMLIAVFLTGVIAAPFVWNVKPSHAADESLIYSFTEDNVSTAVRAAGATDISSGTTQSGARFVAYTVDNRKYRAFLHDCEASNCIGLELSSLFTGATIPVDAMNTFNINRVGGKGVIYTDGSWASMRFVATAGMTQATLQQEVRIEILMTDLLLDQLRGAQLIVAREGPARSAFSDGRMAQLPGRPRPLAGVTPVTDPHQDPAAVNVLH